MMAAPPRVVALPRREEPPGEGEVFLGRCGPLVVSRPLRVAAHSPRRFASWRFASWRGQVGRGDESRNL